ncbi:MAG: hypothetical protein COA78_09195 [Blastopirellula sp.]|nr:MAG: hypothetical protein COA78_09195 [Blastopirellula sp.]
MRIVVAEDGDEETSILSLKPWLIENNFASHVPIVPLNRVVDQSAQLRPNVIILNLHEDVEHAVEIVRDIRETMPTRIIVIGPTIDAKWILQLLKEGVYQYINQEDVKAELRDALGRLDKSSPTDQDFGSLIAIVSAGGGSGASTVAANVATGLSSRHGDCGLVDLRLTSGTLATLFDLHPSHTLADFCRNIQRMDQDMFQRCLEPHESGVQLLSSPNSYHEISSISKRGVRKALGMARSKFKYVVADLDSPYQAEQSPALLQADTILLVLMLDFSSVRHAQQILEYFDELELDRDQIHLTINRYGRPKELRIKDVEKTLGLKVRHIIPDASRQVNRANNIGKPVVLDNPRSAVSKKLIEISHLVNGKPTT